MNPSELSRQLRQSTSDDMNRRRGIIGLSVLGVAIGGIVGLYQTGIVKTLPDPPIDIFDSPKVNASDYAYKRLGVPDAFLMILTYGTTALLAAMDGDDRPKRNPLIAIAMSGKIAMDIATNLKLAQEEYAENKKLCAYCQSATVISVASLLLALPEAKRAWKNWRS